MTTAKILGARARVSCSCGKPYVVAIDDYTNFARCPHCDAVVWIDATAKVHETDPVEHPDKDMIAQGEVEEATTRHVGGPCALSTSPRGAGAERRTPHIRAQT